MPVTESIFMSGLLEISALEQTSGPSKIFDVKMRRLFAVIEMKRIQHVCYCCIKKGGTAIPNLVPFMG